MPSSASHYLYQPVPRVCVKHCKKTIICAVPSFQRTVLLVSSRGQIWTKSSLLKSHSVCVRVCVKHMCVKHCKKTIICAVPEVV